MWTSTSLLEKLFQVTSSPLPLLLSPLFLIVSPLLPPLLPSLSFSLSLLSLPSPPPFSLSSSLLPLLSIPSPCGYAAFSSPGKPVLLHECQRLYLHRLLQSRLFGGDAPLLDCYQLLHTFCLNLKLDCLHSQVSIFCANSHSVWPQCVSALQQSLCHSNICSCYSGNRSILFTGSAAQL